LPNGNTLITEDNRGHVFEITKTGEIVWEFYTPSVYISEDKKQGKKRAAIYRMTRVRHPESYSRLKDLITDPNLPIE
jgi:hypothetical protein